MMASTYVQYKTNSRNFEISKSVLQVFTHDSRIHYNIIKIGIGLQPMYQDKESSGSGYPSKKQHSCTEVNKSLQSPNLLIHFDSTKSYI